MTTKLAYYRFSYLVYDNIISYYTASCGEKKINYRYNDCTQFSGTPLSQMIRFKIISFQLSFPAMGKIGVLF